MNQPIYAFVHGRDKSPGRLMPTEESSTLNDWFGTYLQKTPPDQRPYTLRNLLNNAPEAVPPRTWRPFAVCDGIGLEWDDNDIATLPDGVTKLNSLPRHLRFVITCVPTDPDKNTNAQVKNQIGNMTGKGGFCIVASQDADSPTAFMQLASWDPKAQDGKSMGYFRFYQRVRAILSPSKKPEWMYFGNSWDAFKLDTEGSGPFDGHIGGGLIMKELKVPWIHWVSQVTPPSKLAETVGRNSVIARDKLFTKSMPFDLLGNGEEFQAVVETIVGRWYYCRSRVNFMDLTTKTPLATITGVKSWLSHVLQSHTMNMNSTNRDSHSIFSASRFNAMDIPQTFWINLDVFSRLLPDIDTRPSIPPDQTVAIESFGFEAYSTTLDTLETCLVAGFEETTNAPIIVQRSWEGEFPWPMIEAGLEDCAGIHELINLATQEKNPIRLLSVKAITCLLMVDFWNPVYSADRDKLFRYVPNEGRLLDNTGQYDVLDVMVARMKDAIATDPMGTKVEQDFLTLLDTDDATYQKTFTDRVNTYLRIVRTRLSSTVDSSGVEEYMILAESRRRVYRSRENEKSNGRGLNEFSMTLPYALNDNLFGEFYEMTEEGQVIPVKDEPKKAYLVEASVYGSNAFASEMPWSLGSFGCDSSDFEQLRHLTGRYPSYVYGGGCPVAHGS